MMQLNGITVDTLSTK